MSYIIYYLEQNKQLVEFEIDGRCLDTSERAGEGLLHGDHDGELCCTHQS